MGSIPRSSTDYTVGWICALPIEMAAAKAMLDENHSTLPQIDDHVYELGAINGHNIVIACLPGGVYGTSSAAVAATQMSYSFPNISFGLMVGIAGGVPSETADIRLGDVVVSRPVGTLGGVVQYDYGKTVRDGKLRRTGSLSKPPSHLLRATATLEANHSLGDSQIPAYLSQMLRRHRKMNAFEHPGSKSDILFDAEYQHIESSDYGCNDCSRRYRVHRQPRDFDEPVVHYGTVASGNQVMRDGTTRDRIACELGGSVLCFEMEASGLMDTFPCLVIRGICDYADSHKNKEWQPYAAATAAAYAKELLSILPAPPTRTTREPDTSREGRLSENCRRSQDEVRFGHHTTNNGISIGEVAGTGHNFQVIQGNSRAVHYNQQWPQRYDGHAASSRRSPRSPTHRYHRTDDYEYDS